MTCKWKIFDNLEVAIKFLKNKSKAIKSTYWAGGYVEDEKCNIIYEISDK